MARGRADNGSGTIYKHKDRKKAYQVIFTVDGKRKSGGYYLTKAEAIAALHEIVTAVDKGDYIEPQKITLAEWLDIWVREYCRGVKESTKLMYSAYIRNHITPAIGHIVLSDLRPHHIQQFVNHMEYQGKKKGKTLSYKTVKNIHGCLSSALETAVKIRYIKENPAAGCTIPRDDEDSRTTIVKPLDTAQIIQFTSAIEGTKYERIYLTALYTGMRLSEIIGLQWDRVNLQTGEIIISKQLTMKREKGSARRMVSTKSRKIRSIIIPQTAIDVLTEQKKAQAQQQLQAGSQWENDLNLVFTGDYGSSVPHASVEHDFKRIVRGMQLPDRRFHDLRHTFATEAIRAGVDVETVSKALGHFSVGFTLDVYGHVTQEMKVEAARRIQQAIDSRRNA